MKNVFILFFILASCGDSSSPSSGVVEKPSVTEYSVNHVEANLKEHVDSLETKNVPLLDIAFLERLESVGDGNLNTHLAKYGFMCTSTLKIDDGIKLHFVNKALNNTLTLTKTNYQEGGKQFSADYIVTEPQLQQFEAQLASTSYRLKQVGFYKKKGLGTYVEKAIRLSKRPFSISYVHYMGKETGVMLPETLPTLQNL